MTGEKRTYAELLGLFDTTHPEIEHLGIDTTDVVSRRSPH